MTKEQNPPLAFPFVSHGGAHEHQYVDSGMTLRDYFAAKALDASIAAGHDIVMRGHEGWRDELAREAYRYADSMILAREATP